MKIEILRTHLHAISLFQADRDIRYYLNGIFIEATKKTGIVAVATDGHTLGACYCGSWDGDDVKLIIPTDALKMVGITKADKHFPFVIIENVDGRWTISIGARSVGFAPVDGIFPDWRRVVPQTSVSGEYRHINPDYLVRVHSAFKIAYGSKNTPVDLVSYGFNGDGVTVFKSESVGYLVCLVMPMRHASATFTEWSAPQWAMLNPPEDENPED